MRKIHMLVIAIFAFALMASVVSAEQDPNAPMIPTDLVASPRGVFSQTYGLKEMNLGDCAAMFIRPGTVFPQKYVTRAYWSHLPYATLNFISESACEEDMGFRFNYLYTRPRKTEPITGYLRSRYGPYRVGFPGYKVLAFYGIDPESAPYFEGLRSPHLTGRYAPRAGTPSLVYTPWRYSYG